MDPWIAQLTTQLLNIFPPPSGLDFLPDTSPEPRVSIVDGPNLSALSLSETEVDQDEYWTATLTKNERITSKDWFQDVRHFEFDFDEDIQYAFSSSRGTFISDYGLCSIQIHSWRYCRHSPSDTSG